jgi:hypothetical protein
MRKLLLGMGFSLTAVLAGTGVATATLIDFNEFTNEFGEFTGPLDSKGFHFANNAPAGGAPFAIWGFDNPWNADPGGATLSHNFALTTTTLTRVGGGAFEFDSVDFGNVYNLAGNQEDVTLVGTLGGGGTISTVVRTNGMAGLTHFEFDGLFLDVTQITWTPSNGVQNNFLQVDNVAVDSTSTAIPEPLSIFILIASLSTFGLMRCHPLWLRKRFGLSSVSGGIPDQYERDQPELIHLRKEPATPRCHFCEMPYKRSVT